MRLLNTNTDYEMMLSNHNQIMVILQKYTTIIAEETNGNIKASVIPVIEETQTHYTFRVSCCDDTIDLELFYLRLNSFYSFSTTYSSDKFGRYLKSLDELPTIIESYLKCDNVTNYLNKMIYSNLIFNK